MEEVGRWDGGCVGWWVCGMVGAWEGGMVGWWDDPQEDEESFHNTHPSAVHPATGQMVAYTSTEDSYYDTI